MRIWGMTSESQVQLPAADRAELEGWVAGRNTPQKLVWRARIVLMWADGAGITKIVQATGKTKRTAYRWRFVLASELITFVHDGAAQCDR